MEIAINLARAFCVGVVLGHFGIRLILNNDRSDRAFSIIVVAISGFAFVGNMLPLLGLLP